MEKIRRCREHATVLKNDENCSFLKHDKNNKIEEMTEQEAEILEWVEINTEVELWKNNETGQEELWIKPKEHYKTNKTYYREVIFNPQTQNLNEVIIIVDIKGNIRKKDKWTFEKVVYEFCPKAICGENPCRCGKENYGEN